MKIKLSFFRYLAYAIEILIFCVLQDTPKLMPEIFGAKPLLLAALALSIAAFENKIPSLVFGALCGIFADSLTGEAIGYFAILLTLICYFEAHIFEKYFVSKFLSAFVFAFLSTAVLICGYFLIFTVFSGIDGALTLFVNHYISRILYTALMFIPIYFLNRFLYRRLNKSNRL